jgi:serine/threonine protein kinase
LYYPLGKTSSKNLKEEHLELPPFQYVSFRLESELSPSFDYDDIEFGKQLAKGGYGTVYLAKWRGAEVAVKVLNSQEMVEEEKEIVQREITLMR